MNSDKKLAGYKTFTRFGLSFIFLSFLSISCGDNTKFFELTTVDDGSFARERPTGTVTLFDVLRLNIYLDNFLLNETSPVIRVEGLVDGSSIKLMEGSCQGEVVSSLDRNGVFEGLGTFEDYTEIQYYVELSYQGKKECKALEKSWVHLLSPTLSLNEEQTALDKRKPQFNAANLFSGKEVELGLYETPDCSGESLSSLVNSSSGDGLVGVKNPIGDLNNHTYYVKQSYKDVSTCSLVGVDYAYSLELENISLSYDDVILGGSEGVVEVAKVLPGSTVSLHKESCNSEADDTLTEDGTLTPTTTNTYTDVPLYVKYTYDQTSVCSEIGSRYVYLEKATLALNQAQTSSHKRTPTFDVTNLYAGKNVEVALYESASCSGTAVSETVNSSTGSAVVSISSELNDNNTHTYYLKQSYAGVSSCSEGVQYTYGLDIEDLTITSDPILYGTSPSSISVSGMIPGSSVSIHKGSCNSEADDSITSDGTLTPTPTNTYTETDIYLKYSLNQGSSCQSIGVSYLNLVAPVLSLNSTQTNQDKRSPKFNASNLFSGKNVAATIYESADCSGVAVSEVVNSITGSALLSLTSALSDTATHTYSVKQSYQGYTSCSNSLNYQYSIDTANLTVSSSSILYGVSPGSVTVSKMLSGSTVSLHKGSCNAVADASVSSDGTLTPTSTGSYNYSELYIKYTKGVESDCDSIASHYLYLEQPTLSLNSSQTDLHPLTPTFNVANLYSGKSVTAQLFESNSCTGDPVSASSSSSTGSTTLTLSSVLTDSDTHSYYVKQSYQGFSSCSSGFAYSFSADTSDLSLTYAPVLYGTNPTGVAVSGMVEGSTVSLYKGNNCNGVADATISSDGTLTPLVANSYTESDIYLKYSFDESSSCTKLDTSYIYLESPSISLGALVADARRPSFDVTGLFNGKSVTTTLHESLDCSGPAVSTSVVSSTGSATVTKTSALTDLNSHPYSVKQSYGGVTSCSNSLSYQYSVDVDNLSISADTTLYGTSPGSVTVSNMLSGSTVSLHKGSCNTDPEASRSSDGTLTPLVPNPATYQEVDLYIKYTFNATSDCKAVGSKYLYLKSPTLALNSASTALDPRTPIFDVTDLYSGKTKTITLYNGSNCTGSIVKAATATTLGSTTISPTEALTSTDSYNYSVKQTYEGYSTCSNAVAYQYSIDTSNLVVVADELLYGTTPGSVSVSHMLSGSTVSLHKGSCNAVADSSITEDGTLTPSSTGSYNYSQLYIKYTKGVESDCDPLDSYYLYLEQPALSLNSSQTNQHPLTPTFNVTNLYSGKSVTAQLFEDSSCSGDPVSTSSSSSTGSTSLTLSVALADTNSHTYYVKQTYLGESSCSLGVNYSISVDTSSLTVTTSITNGVLNASVSDGYVGSTVSLHKGTCNAASSDSATFTAVDQELDLSVSANSYTYQDVYLKYSFIGESDCLLLDKKLTYLANPTLAIATPLSDKRVPEFNITGLYSGQTVTVQVYESSNCTGSTVTSSSTTNTGSKSLTKSSALTDLSSHTYSAKQTFNGISTCSNSVSYQYQIDTENLVIVADDLLYGTTPGSVTVSNMISGSTVSLHKGSCNAVADASINADGSLTPTSTGSYNYSQLYIKYTKGGNTDCDPLDSYYLYLEQPTLSLNSTQTDTHPQTPTFNVTNLYSGKSVTAQLYESSTCTGVAVSGSSSSSSGSTTLTLSSAISDGAVHTYYVKQSYLGESSCSEGVNYNIPVEAEDLTITTSITNGVLSASVEGGYVGSTVSLHKGTCNAAASDSASFTSGGQTLNLSVTSNSYSYQDVYLKYTLNTSNDCVLLDKKLTYLATPTLALVSPLSDKRVPEFNITGLYSGQIVSVQVYESSNCTGSTVTTSSTTNTGSKTLTKSSALTDISSHSYSAKQTFNGISSCSNSISYTYPLDVDNLTVNVDSILYGATPGSVSVSGMLSGSTVSLHKGSCGTATDVSRSSDGNLTPSVPEPLAYQEVDLYLKYSFNETSDCKSIGSKYLYLTSPVLALNAVSTATDPRTPVFDVTDLYSGKTKTITLYNGSNCTGSVVRSATSTTLGSTTISPTSTLTSTDSYNYSVAQTYEGYTTCSNAVAYKYDIDVDNLNLTYDAVINGKSPTNISVANMLSGSTVSVHRGSCEAAADNSISSDGNIKPSTTSAYVETDLYLKYTKGVDSDCEKLNTKYIVLEQPTITLNGSFTNKLIPEFDIANLFTGKNVTVTLHTNSTCTSAAVSSEVQTDTGSTTLAISTPLTDTNSHSYYVKQSYAGLSSCSTVRTYQYTINVSNLVLAYDSVQYGTSPTGISVSNMIAGSTVYLYKNSTCSGTNTSITSDGIIYPVTSSGNSQTGLSLKYYKSTSNCLANFATYLSLATPGLTLNTSETNQHRLTPTFNVTNLYSAKSPTVAIYEDSTCSGDPVTTPITSSTTSKTVILASELSDNNTHTYYAGQTYMGFTSCSSVLNYKVVDINTLTITAPATVSGDDPGSITVSGIMTGSTVSLHKGSCNSEADDSIASNGSLTPIPVNEAINIDLYLKYTYGLVADCKLVSKYINFDPITTSLNSSITSEDPALPGINVSGLMTEAPVTVTLHFNPECTDTPRSTEVETDSGSITIQQNVPLTTPGLYKYYVKETYQGVSRCFSTDIEYRYKTYPEFDSFLHEQTGYPTNQNRGIIVKNTTFGNKIKLYTGTDCTDPEHLVTTVRTIQDKTNIETPSLADGTYRFSFLELDSSDNEIGCYTTPTVTMRSRRFVSYSSNRGSVFVELDSTKRNVEITIEKKYAQSFSKNIKHIYRSGWGAVALLFEDGSVLSAGARSATGSSSLGADSSSVASDLDGTIPVTAIYSNDYAFAALRSDGSVVTWGDSNYGGDSSSVASDLDGTIPVTAIYSTYGAFAAVRSDGSVVTWGFSSYGGDSSSVASDIDGTIPVITIYRSLDSIGAAFAALRSDGSVVTWGEPQEAGGDSSSVASDIDGTIPVITIYEFSGGFIALRSDGSVVTWGYESYDGLDSSSVASDLDGTIPVTAIYSNGYSALAALRSDGSVVTWGSSSYGGDSSSVASKLDGTIPVTGIYPNGNAFAAVRSDGSVVAWGNSSYGGNSSSVSSSINGTIPVTTIYSTGKAFAALRNDGSVVTWGDSSYGGYSGSVASKLDGTIPVTAIYSNGNAFAAVRSDGSVVTWGYSSYGGYSGSVASKLDGTIPVTTIYSSGQAFAALRNDGSVVTWGNSSYGGNSSSVTTQLNGTIDVIRINSVSFYRSGWSGFFIAERADGSLVKWNAIPVIRNVTNVIKVGHNNYATAAILSDGSVVTWGDYLDGGDSSSVATKINGTIPVTTIYSTYVNGSGGAFAALRNDGSVVTWGDLSYGGSSSSVSSSIDGTIPVTAIYSTSRAFAALRNDGAVVTWGMSSYGGSSSSVATEINGTIPVTAICSTNYGAFAALRSDGSVVTWGDSSYGGDSSSVASDLDGTIPVTAIYSTPYAFAALRSDGSVVTWGYSSYGGNSSSVSSSIDGTIPVTAIYSTAYAFAALRSDGSVVTWGYSSYGGSSSSVASKINGGVPVTAIYSTGKAFAALRNDGSVVTWGDSSNGGNSSSVASKINGGVPVTAIYSTSGAFAALRSDGSVVTWGASSYGGNSSSVATKINGTIPVTAIYSTGSAFAALRNDGSVVTWGVSNRGGDSSEVAEDINGDVDVTKVFVVHKGFLVERSDGKTFLWDGEYKRKF